MKTMFKRFGKWAIVAKIYMYVRILWIESKQDNSNRSLSLLGKSRRIPFLVCFESMIKLWIHFNRVKTVKPEMRNYGNDLCQNDGLETQLKEHTWKKDLVVKPYETNCLILVRLL